MGSNPIWESDFFRVLQGFSMYLYLHVVSLIILSCQLVFLISFIHVRKISLSFADDDSVYLKAVLRLRSVTFTSELSNLLSNRSRSLAGLLEGEIMRLYKRVPDVRDVNVVAFRCVSALVCSKIISLFDSEIEILAVM